MSKNEGDRDAVFKTTKVRTKLMGDNWWMQRAKNPEPEPPQAQEEEKPWIAEVRLGRLNGEPVESSPVASDPPTDPTPVIPVAERAPPSGYLIRGVFTKTESKPAAPPSTTNGFSGRSGRSGSFTKRPSDTYKKIAPHTVRSAPESAALVETEGQLSPEEQERRREAASNVLKTSSVRKRSYVLSAAKKYESTEKPPDTPEVNGSPAFVAKRVEITDDDDEPPVPPMFLGSPASSPVSPSPATPPLSSVSPPDPPGSPAADTAVPPEPTAVPPEPTAQRQTPEPTAVPPEPTAQRQTPEPTAVPPEPTAQRQTTVESEVEDLMEEEPVAAPVDVPEPLKEEVVPPVPSLTEDPTEANTTTTTTSNTTTTTTSTTNTTTTTEIEDDPFAHMKPGCIKVFIPLPELPLECVLVEKEEEEVRKDPRRPADSDDSGREDTPPLSPVVRGSDIQLECSLPPEEEDAVGTDDPRPEVSPTKHSVVESLDALSETLISFDTAGSTSLLDTGDENDPCDSCIPAPDSFKDAEAAPQDDETELVDTPSDHTIDQEPAPEVSNCIVMTDDLLSLTDGPEESSGEPVPSSPGRWSHDLLGGPTDSDSYQVKTSSSLDLLADDVIPINTETHSLSAEQSRDGDTASDDTTTTHAEDTPTTPPHGGDTTPCMGYTTPRHSVTDDTAPRADDTAPPHTPKDTQQSSADPFDPFPIGRTTSPSNSSTDLVSHTSPHHDEDEERPPSPQITSMSGDALDSLADDVIPIDTDTERLHSDRTWSRTWATGVPEHTPTPATVEESSAPASGHVEEPGTLVTFERKSTENDSPWDRWTSPTVYALTTTQEEEEEGDEDEQEPEAEEEEDSETLHHHGDLEPVMDRYQTYSSATEVAKETRHVETPEPESKKGCVFVKEYVDAGELSLHNARDQDRSGSEYLTSSSSSYSRPSNYSRVSESSACTYCGEQVGNDAKITIEHLNISCHPACFQCGVCSRPMGDLLYNMFLHGGKVHCESCYATVFH